MQICVRATSSGAEIHGGDWSEAVLGDADLSDARIENVTFKDASTADSNWDRCVIRGCDFRNVDLSHKLKGANLGCAHGTRFERCDFRGANLDGFRLKDTVFDQCPFHGVVGMPELQGEVTFIAPDLSESYDGTSIVGADELLAEWSR